MSKANPILVVIPYCSDGSQGRELEYAVAGWRKHFKEDYLIVLAGEDHPITKTGDDIVCVPSPRVEAREGQYRQHLDYVSCFRKVHEAFPKSKGYIRVADDCYAVRDFDMQDVLTRKCISHEVGINPFATPGSWAGDQRKTRDKLLADGYPVVNFTTHLPQWFEWKKIEALWEKYHMDETSYVDELLYYNIYEGNRAAINVHSEDQPYKCGVYRSNPSIDYIERCIGKRIWITNSPDGWVPQLDAILNKYYFGAGDWVFTNLAE